MFRTTTIVALLAAVAVATPPVADTKVDMPAAPGANQIVVPKKTMLKVICAPQEVALNTPFYVNLEFASPFKRPMAVHVDMLNADTHEWIAGDMVKVVGAKGKVTARVMVPQDAKEPFAWHAYIAPAEENWPNMLASTNFTAPMGAKVAAPCAPLRNAVHDPKEAVDFDYVVVTDYPQGFKAGSKSPVAVQYNVVPGSESTYVSAALLRASDNTVVAVQQLQAEEGEHTAKMMLDVPADAAASEPVYLMATLKPAGKAFSERVAEDRVWNTGVYNGRRHLLRTGAN